MGVVEVVDHNVKCGQEGVHVEHEGSVPFPWGSGSRPTLERGHLPLKSSIDNSHQAFKCRWTLYDRTKNRSDAWCDPAQSPVGTTPAPSNIRITVRSGARVRCTTPRGTAKPC